MDELPTTANGVLAMMANTSVEIDIFSDQVIQSVKNGEVDPLKVLIQMKAMDRASERITKEIKENCMNAAEKYPGNSFEFMGNTIAKGSVHTSYDYSACKDPLWNDLDKMIKSLTEQKKAREGILQKLDKPYSELNEETGEVSKILPAIKKETPGLKVTIK